MKKVESKELIDFSWQLKIIKISIIAIRLLSILNILTLSIFRDRLEHCSEKIVCMVDESFKNLHT